MGKFLVQPLAAIPFWPNKIVAFLFYFRTGIGQNKANRLGVLYVHSIITKKKIKLSKLKLYITARIFQYPKRTAIPDN